MAIHCVDCWAEGVQLVRVKEGEYSSPDTYRCLQCFATGVAKGMATRVRDELLVRIAALEQRLAKLDGMQAVAVAENDDEPEGGDE